MTYYLGGQWNPIDGFQPLEMVSPYPEELLHTHKWTKTSEDENVVYYECECGAVKAQTKGRKKK